MTIDELIENFEFLEDWEERYGYIIELGRRLPAMADEQKTEESLVDGCTSQVWLTASVGKNENGQIVMNFIADSDAHIVRGLVAILLMLFSGKTPQEIVSIDAKTTLGKLNLDEHLSTSRKNGLYSMIARIKKEAVQAV
ncbi:MAG: SufE family protein [Alphaproteobacteria bacterium]|nr:SufE family protein [Alphaproteobacteria bacterium]